MTSKRSLDLVHLLLQGSPDETARLGQVQVLLVAQHLRRSIVQISGFKQWFQACNIQICRHQEYRISSS